MSKRMTLLVSSVVLAAGTAMAQKVVTGTVVDADGEPVIGANVMITGTKIGTATDNHGKFTIKNVPSSAKKVTVSYIGMESKTVSISANVNIVMKESNVMEEVVVNGMQKTDRRLNTGATAKVDAEKIKFDGVPDVSRALDGRVAGVQMQNVSGTFGTAPKIRVRGATSIYGSNKPLWVIDGVIQEDAVEVSADDLSSGDATTLISNAIAGLSADDIESFQVLKDGSATSIYGARAMAGVIVITTKRGRAGVSTVNYTGEFTYRMKPSYSDYNICNSQEQMGIYKEMAAKGWLEFASLANGSTSGLYGQMYTLMAKYDPETGQYGMPNTESAMNAYLRNAEFRNTDWFDLLFKDNIQQSHSVSISSGTDKASLYASLSVFNDPGWSIDSDVERYTANMNAQFNLSRHVTVGLLGNANYRDQKAPGTLNQSTDVVSGAVNRSFDINPFSYALNTSRTLDPKGTYKRNYAPFNIFDELDNNYLDLSIADVKFQGNLTWKPLEGLEFNGLGAYRVQKIAQEHIILNKSNMAEAYRAGVDDPNIMYSNPYLYTDPDQENALPVCVMPVGGIYYRDDNSLKQLDFRVTGQYTKQFRNSNLINAFLGMEVNKTDRDYLYNREFGVDYDNARLVSITPEFYKQCKEEGASLAGFSKTWTRSLAYFANASYAYQGKYIVNGTIRYEGTNKLGKTRSARWLPTWNISGAWNAHEEKFFQRFMQNTNYAWSHASIRLSYSLTADRGPSSISNAREQIYATEVWRPLGSDIEQALLIANFANSELTYEKKYEFNVGFELGFLNNRLNLNGDVYTRDNFDLIGYTITEGVGGTIGKYANVAAMKSYGVEGTLTTHNIKTKDWSWDTDFTFSWADNRITDLQSRSRVIDLVRDSGNNRLEGYPRSAIFSIPFMGLNDEGLPMIMNEKGEVTTNNINFQEYDDLDFLVYEGPTEAPITGGFNNTIRWKNLRLNVFFTYNFGNVIRLDAVYAAAYSDMTAMPKEFKNRWVMSGDENVTNVPAIASRRQYFENSAIAYAYNAYNYSTARIAKGDFIRLKDISLTYDFPRLWCGKIGISHGSFRLAASNLWLAYADKKLNGQDPEFVNAGGVAQPLSRQFTFTVRFGI